MEQNQLDILNLVLNAGVVVKIVIAILIGFSIYTWAIVLMKYFYHKKIKINHNQFQNEFNNIKSIFEVAETNLKSKSLSSNILLNSLHEMKKIEMSNELRTNKKLGIEQELAMIERSIESSISECSLQIRRFNSTLASISSIAPFVGLFGTVWGIINSFQGLAGGGGSIQAVAPGIAEALVATAIGLAAAIPANWFFNKFTSEASIVEQSLVNFGRDVMNLIQRSI